MPNQRQWKVVPLSTGQLLDVNPEDVLENGLYRKCNTYRGGGGYDQFPIICRKRLGVKEANRQFVVQLYGCHLDCPYCYVTRAGVWGHPNKVSSTTLLDAFERSQQEVFHLMGGAPAIYLSQWADLIKKFNNRFPMNIFHSDFLLTEKKYAVKILKVLASMRMTLFVVNVKGTTQREHYNNTRKPWREDLFWENLVNLTQTEVPYYVTFTNVAKEHQETFWDRYGQVLPRAMEEQREDAFTIDLIDYEAVAHVDNVEWGIDRVIPRVNLQINPTLSY